MIYLYGPSFCGFSCTSLDILAGLSKRSLATAFSSKQHLLWIYTLQFLYECPSDYKSSHRKS